jgi:hypothetical protein
MPSQPFKSSWDFQSALDLIDSDVSIASPALLLRHHRSDANTVTVVSDDRPNIPITLGTFDKIWQNLGISIEARVPELSSRSALNGNTQDVADDLSVDSAESPTKAAQAGVDDPYAGMTKNQRHNARKRANKIRKAEELQQKEDEKQGGKQLLQQLQATVEEELQPKPTAGNPPPQSPVRMLTRSRAKAQAEAAGKVEPKQILTSSRSNVGAKIRPASPAPNGLPAPVPRSNINPPFINQLPAILTPTRLPAPAIDTLTPALPGTYFPLAPRNLVQRYNHTSIGSATPLSASHATNVPMPPALANLNATLHTQYNTFGTPVGYQNQLQPGFLPLSNGMMNISTPGFSPVHTGLVPASVTHPLTDTRKKANKALTRSREDRDFEFLKKLIYEFSDEKKWLVAPMRMMSDKLSPEGIHVFVDASNILIGFRDMLRRSGSPTCDMSFDCLALLLERRRPVKKRVYAGSTRPSAPIATNEKFNDLAGAVGYEKNIYEQVFKVKELTDSQKFFKDVDRVGWVKASKMRSGSGSDSETGAAAQPSPPPAPKWVEQGVDESLHLKMCQSIIDADAPCTMVLATGDGAVAEYSDGFLAHVERALKKGWTVELVSWKQQTSSGYKNKNFRAKWGDRFKIIELDDYLEFMIDTQDGVVQRNGR